MVFDGAVTDIGRSNDLWHGGSANPLAGEFEQVLRDAIEQAVVAAIQELSRSLVSGGPFMSAALPCVNQMLDQFGNVDDNTSTAGYGNQDGYGPIADDPSAFTSESANARGSAPGGNPADVEAALASYQPEGITAEGKERVTQALAYVQETLNLTPEQAAGLVGNLQQESGVNLDPTALGDGGQSLGIAQWLGPRREALVEFAGGDSTPAFQTQLDFLVHEFQTTERAALDSLLAAQSPEEAAQAVSDDFLRPGIPVMEARQAYAGDLLPIAQTQSEGVLA